MPDNSESNEVPSLQELRRLGRNVNGYFGETINIGAVLTDCVSAAQAQGWAIEEIPAGEKLSLLALTRASGPADKHAPQGGAPTTEASSLPTPATAKRVYISAGIHGDEPAGPLAIRELLQQGAFPAHLEFTLLPCLNPAGFVLNRRENGDGLDLNRQYHQPAARETRAHIDWLQRQAPFDLCLCLHEDWESHGFYVYELNPEHRPSLAESVVARVSAVCPIDRSEIIEGRPAHGGIIRPDIDPATRPQWPESFFLLTHKTRVSYTLEAPSDFPLPARVQALTVSVKTALETLRA